MCSSFVHPGSSLKRVLQLTSVLFQEWINENVISDFQDYYVVDLDPNEKEGYLTRLHLFNQDFSTKRV